MQNHKKLRVWAKAHALAIQVRRATRRFPRSNYQSLRSQLTRAAESIVLTIVEGCGASTAREFGRFLDMAIKSTSELEEGLLLARDFGAMSHSEWERLTHEAVDIRRMLCGLRAKVLAKAAVHSGSHG